MTLPTITFAAEGDSGGSFLVSPSVGLMVWTLFLFAVSMFILYKVAFPRLRRMGWPAVLDLAGLNLKWSGGLSPAMVKRMIAAGWELASHTISHVDLTAAPPSRLRYEVAVSRRLYRRWFHVPVYNFCYPSGSYDRRVQAAVKGAGYRGALAVSPGLARRSQRYALNRIRVYRGDRLSDLAKTLRALGA